MNRLSLYVHIPYCKRHCYYCDFNIKVVARIPERQYTQALIAELIFLRKQHGKRLGSVSSIYFGGGTPSLFSPASMGSILDQINKNFDLSAHAEITLETNPDDVNPDRLHAYRASGVNRVSLGVQSFQDELLRASGRSHTAKQALYAVKQLTQAGFDNFNMDLICGLPYQTASHWQQDIEQALKFAPTHLSIYHLSLEPNTPLQKILQNKPNILPADPAVVSRWQRARSRLAEQGYQHYEVSNFALPGYESQHNLNYWNFGSYLGLGAGAHSFLAPAMRWHNIKDVNGYMQTALQHNDVREDIESLSNQQIAQDFWLCHLRKLKGVDLNHAWQFLGAQGKQYYLPKLKKLQHDGFLIQDQTHIHITDKGLLFLDSVTSELF